MSLSVTTDVFCDGCNTWVEGTHGRVKAEPAEARRIAKEAHGWWRINGQDLCPKCAKAEP